MKNISEVLRNSREDLDLTQVDVMKITGVNNKTLSGYENGVAEPDLETFAKLLKLYGLSADNVLEINQPVGAIQKPLSDEEKLLIGEIRQLTDEQREDLFFALKAIVQKNKSKK